MNNPKFHNKNGTLTAYAFACGYCEKAQSETMVPYTVWIVSPPYETTTPAIEASLYLDGACYHVTMREADKGRTLWECFDKLTDARKYYKALKKQHKLI